MTTREIKFRAWSKITKSMSPARPLLTFLEIAESEAVASLKNNDPVLVSTLYPHWIMLQFTGLKDKNGLDIYEHDLVEYDGIVYTIQFQSGAFILEHNDMDNLRLPAPAYPELFEIKGNIYENKR